MSAISSGAPPANVANAQRLGIRLYGVSDGTNSGDVPLQMNVLLGDTNANGAVNTTDIGQVKSNSGQALSTTNFRSDVTPNGSINTSDIGTVKSASGTELPPL